MYLVTIYAENEILYTVKCADDEECIEDMMEWQKELNNIIKLSWRKLHG